MFDSSVKVKGDVLILKNKFPIRIGLLPDMHCGATRGLCTPVYEWRDAGGLLNKYHANDVQLMMYELFKRNIALFKKYGVRHIFVVGDACSGENRIEAGAFNFINKSKQVALATNLLEEVWRGCDKKVDFYIWRGTAYHEARAGHGEMHQGIVSELIARGIPAKYMSQVSYVELHGGKDTLSGKERIRRLFISHEAPNALVHPATLMSRDINWCLQSEASGQTLPVDAIVRAHLHTWIHVDHHGIHAVQLPCWQGHTPYKSTIKYFFKLQPTIGGAMMLMDEFGRLQFWGGSYPFGFTKENRIKFHKLCVTMAKVKPEPFKINLKPE